MPYKRKKTYKRKRKKKSTTRGSTGRVVSFNSATPLPNRFKATFRYVEPDIELIPIASPGTNEYVYSMNGMYDPNITGVGHQPAGFDQLMTMYDHYVVIATKAIVTILNSDDNHGALVALDLRDTSTSLGDIRVAIESGTCKYVTLGNDRNSKSQQTISYNINPNKFLGRSKPLSDPELKGGATFNPPEQCYLHICTTALRQDQSTGEKLVLNVVLEYTAIMIEPKPVGLS